MLSPASSLALTDGWGSSSTHGGHRPGWKSLRRSPVRLARSPAWLTGCTRLFHLDLFPKLIVLGAVVKPREQRPRLGWDDGGLIVLSGKETNRRQRVKPHQGHKLDLVPNRAA